jgi:hypothetical protein
MLDTDVIYFFKLELFSINSKSEYFDKIYFGNNCLNVYFPRFASTIPLMNSLEKIVYICIIFIMGLLTIDHSWK